MRGQQAKESESESASSEVKPEPMKPALPAQINFLDAIKARRVEY